MPAAPLPADEQSRLLELYELDLLDTPDDAQLNDLTQIVAGLFGTPIALISLVDSCRQWFKSRYGLAAHETAREVSFCAHAILSSEVMVVADALYDSRFADSPLVLGPPYIRFYAGAPLRSAQGSAIGTLCIAGDRPRTTFSQDDVAKLRSLANIVETHLSLKLLAARVLHDIAARQDFVQHADLERRTLRSQLDDSRQALTGLAGDLRAPLDVVRDCVALLRAETRRSQYNAALGPYAEMIERAAGQVEAVGVALMERAGRLPGELIQMPCRLDLEETLRDAVALVGPSARLGGLSLDLEIAPGDWRVWGEPGRLKHVFLALLANAIHFTPHGGRICATLARVETGVAGIWVADTGVGMAPSELAAAFTPPERPIVSSSGRCGHHGKGLQTARAIAERHGGTLTLDSTLGAGTTAFVRLPLTD